MTLAFGAEIIAELQDAKKFGNARVYDTMLRSIRNFVKGKDFPLKQLTYAWLKKYEAFYGIILDPADPYLERNLARLEIRFAERYKCSLKKEIERRELGKPAHKTVLRSQEDNKERLEVVRQLRNLLAQSPKGVYA